MSMLPREWLRLLLDVTGTCTAVRDALAVAEEGIVAKVDEAEVHVLVENLRCAAAATDLYFVDQDGPFAPIYADMPARVLAEIGADALFSPDMHAALRDKINADMRANVADGGV